jgi:DNA-binding transcriptional LysR family regulator
MDVNLARTFLAVVETGSFVEAANRVHVTQSTISSRIKTLEDLIGQTLFERSKAGASLTRAGLQFQKHALAFVRVWEHARLEVGLAEQHRDHFAIGAQFSLWDGFLLSWAASMRKQVPDIAITASLGFSSSLMEQLIEGTLDLGVMYRPAQRPGLMVEHLFDEELVMVTSGDMDNQSPFDNYVFVNWGPEFQADHANSLPDLAHPGLLLDLGTLGMNYLLEHDATGYFPERVARPFIDIGRLKLVKRVPRFVYPAFAVFPEEKDNDAFAPFLDGLRQLIEQF